MRHAVPAVPLYLIMRGVNSFAFALILTYELAYHTVTLGLTPLQLVTVGVVLESMTLLFELPTGMFADLVSRRLAVVLGVLLIGCGFLLEALVPTFVSVLAAQVLWGIGFTFYSGAESAWLIDEVGIERATPAFLRATQFGFVLTIVGTLGGALLASIQSVLPVLLGACLLLALGVALWLLMSETGFQPAPHAADQSFWRRVSQPARDTVRLLRVHPLLGLIVAIGANIGVSLGAFDRLYTPHLLGQLGRLDGPAISATTWLGVTNTVVSILSLLGAELVRRRAALTDQRVMIRVLLGLYSGMILGSLAFALGSAPALAVAGFCLSQSLRNVSRPLLLLWISQNAERQSRATVISTYWQANALGQVAGSPVLGWVGSAFSVRAALGLGALLYVGTLPLLALAQRRWRRHGEAIR
jgi:DHA3 family tetracycline resistance protein-like MFS transporter